VEKGRELLHEERAWLRMVKEKEQVRCRENNAQEWRERKNRRNIKVALKKKERG